MKISFVKNIINECSNNNELVELRNLSFKDEPVVVSIICLAFNHAKFISRCLDAFLAQKVNFRVEILVHDDASTDGTSEIIRQYHEKYPSIIVPVLQKENQYSKGVNIENQILSKLIKGKYVTICEGDDYWTDSLKLTIQKQMFENHSACRFVVHKTKRVNLDGGTTGFIPNQKTKTSIFSSKEITPTIVKNYFFHTTSYMFLSDDYKKYCSNLPLFAKNMKVGDYALQLYFSTLGDTVYLDREMSIHVDNVPGSWTDKNRKNEGANLENLNNMVLCLKLFDEFTEGKFHDACIGRIRIYEMHVLYKNKKYSDIVYNKDYSRALRRYDRKTYTTIKLMIKHPKLYAFLKKVKGGSNG